MRFLTGLDRRMFLLKNVLRQKWLSTLGVVPSRPSSHRWVRNWWTFRESASGGKDSGSAGLAEVQRRSEKMR